MLYWRICCTYAYTTYTCMLYWRICCTYTYTTYTCMLYCICCTYTFTTYTCILYWRICCTYTYTTYTCMLYWRICCTYTYTTYTCMLYWRICCTYTYTTFTCMLYWRICCTYTNTTYAILAYLLYIYEYYVCYTGVSAVHIRILRMLYWRICCTYTYTTYACMLYRHINDSKVGCGTPDGKGWIHSSIHQIAVISNRSVIKDSMGWRSRHCSKISAQYFVPQIPHQYGGALILSLTLAWIAVEQRVDMPMIHDAITPMSL